MQQQLVLAAKPMTIFPLPLVLERKQADRIRSRWARIATMAGNSKSFRLEG
jgi:hypothetical protein